MVGLYGGSPIEYAAINQLGTEAVPSTTGDVAGATFRSGLAANLTPRLLRANRRFIASPEDFPETLRNFAAPRADSAIFSDLAARDAESEPDPLLDPETANAEYGIKGVLNFDKPVPQSVAKELAEQKREKIQREDVIARGEGGLVAGGAALGAGLTAGLLDPINVAAGFIPFVGEARVATLLGRGAIGAMGVGERAGVRALTGAGQGAVSMAALQPLEFGLSRQEHNDYTMAEALRSIALGTVLGGGLHAGIGAIADRATGRYANPITQRLEEARPQEREALLQGALAQTIEGRPVDIAPALPALSGMPHATNISEALLDRGPRGPARPELNDPFHPDNLFGDLTQAAARAPDDGLRALADAETFLNRPSDEFQAIQKQIDDLEAATAKPKPAEPIEGAGQAPAELSAVQQVAAEADGRVAAVQRAAACIARGFG